MKVVALLIVFLIAGAVFGAIGWFGYRMFVKPVQIERAELADPTPEPTPDPSMGAFESASASVGDRERLPETIKALREFVAAYPASPALPDAKAALGEANLSLLFSTFESPEKQKYTVAKGDSLVKIAGITKSNAELILRSNNLISVDLQIGQTLLIPEVDIAMIVDRASNTLTLTNRGEFLKEYTLQSSVPGSSAVDTVVKDKIAVRDGKRVVFGGKDYPGSERSILLEQGNLTIRSSGGSGVLVSQEEIEEIFPLVSRGSRVTIR